MGAAPYRLGTSASDGPRRQSDTTPANAILQQGAVEIHEQAQGVATEPEVGHQLGFVDRRDLGNGLHFDDQAVFHDDIHLVTTIQFEFLVTHWKLFLPPVSDACLAKLEAEALFIGGFQQPGPQVSMNLDGQTNDLPRQPVVFVLIHWNFGVLCGSVVHFLTGARLTKYEWGGIYWYAVRGHRAWLRWWLGSKKGITPLSH